MTPVQLKSVLSSLINMLYFDRSVITVHVSSMDLFYTFSTSDVDFSRLLDDKHIINGFFHFNVYDVPNTEPRCIPHSVFDFDSSYLTHIDIDFTNSDVPRFVFDFEPPSEVFLSILNNIHVLGLDSEDYEVLSNYIDCTIY